MRRSLSSCVAIGLLFFFSSGRARANPSAHLVYVRGPGADVCPNEDAVRQAVATRLGYDPFFFSAPTTIVVEVNRDGPRFAAQVKLVDSQGIERGTRHLTTHTGQCADLIGTLALTISIAVDPLSLNVPPVSSPSQTAAASAGPPPETAAAPSANAPPATPAPMPLATSTVVIAPDAPEHPKRGPPLSSAAKRIFAGISLLGSVGMALAPTAGATVFAGARLGSLSIQAEGRIDLPVEAPNPPPSRSWALLGSVVGCGHMTSVFVCALAGFESIWASGQAVVPRDAVTLVALGGIRLGTEIAATDRFALVPFIEAVAPIPTPKIQIDGSTVHEFFVVAGDAGISGLARF